LALSGIRRKVDALDNEMRHGGEDCSDGAEPLRGRLNLSWHCTGSGDGKVRVQLALPAIVEQAERRVAALLNLGKYDARADSVDRTGRNDDDVTYDGRTPID
jgi:hypothetical protein